MTDLPPDATAAGDTDLPPGPDWLFCPADRPERFAKAAAAASSVIVDLEDAVAPAHKERARSALRQVADVLDPARVIVRINAAGSAEHAADLAALRDTPLRTVMLPKAETADQLVALDGLRVVALCETPRGILDAAAIARADNCLGLMWGSEDLAAALGAAGSRTADGALQPHALFARVATHYAAAAGGRLSVDAVHLDIGDHDGLTAEARDAATAGYDVKAVIHPAHCAVVRAAFAPDADTLARARRVIDAAGASEHGVFSLDGRHIDEPLVRQARRVVARAAATRPTPTPH